MVKQNAASFVERPVFRRMNTLAITLRNQATAQFRYVSDKILLVGLISLIGYPLYYVIWKIIYPQSYESIFLRLLGMVLCLPLIFHINIFTNTRVANFYLFWYSTFALPFFFTFMTLENNASTAWLMSLVSAIIFLAFILDAFRFLISYAIGSASAIFIYLAMNGWRALPIDFLTGWPVYLFAFSVGFLFNYSAALAKLDQRRFFTAASIGSSVAHELRTPLLSFRLDLDTIRELWPELINSTAVGRSADSQPIVAAFEAALDRMDRQAQHASAILELLLANISERSIERSKFQPASMKETLQHAVESYPFRGSEREKLTISDCQDFSYFGLPELMKHVIFNLLKNSLRAIGEAGRGDIRIRLVPGAKGNMLVLEDTGIGIPPDVLPHVFEPFFSVTKSGTGAGIGLSFCKRVIEGFDGDIQIESRMGEYTRVTITLPHVPAPVGTSAAA